MSVVIKLKGLPFESTAKDIQSFFQGLDLREEEIHLAAYKDGKAAGIAFAVFHSDEDARKAMFKNGKYLGKRYIELFLSSTSEMNTMLQDGVPEPRPPKKKAGGPHEQTKPKGAHNRQNRDQNSFRYDKREFHPPARSRSPLSRHGNSVPQFHARPFRGMGRGSNYGVSNERRNESDNRGPSSFEMRWRDDEDMAQDQYHRLQNERGNLRESMGNSNLQMDGYDRDMHRARGYGKEDGYERNVHRRAPSSNREEREREDLNVQTCCRLYGLPFQITEDEIIDFLEGLSVVKVKMLYHFGGSFAGKKNGRAYVELKSVRDAKEAAKKKHRQYLGSRYVEVHCCSKMEMVEESNRNDEECQRKREEFRGNEDSSYDSRYDSMANPISDLAIKIDPEILNSPSHGMPSLMDGGPDLQNLGISLPNPYLPSDSLELQTLATLKQLASTANINPEDVTAGCVVGIRNLPSTITTEETLDFFYGFPVFQDSVRIHFLAPGRSSGDAMVTFRSSREAAAAIEQLNHKPVGKRNVQLFLV
jgi:RNA recognition motif-containing protein